MRKVVGYVCGVFPFYVGTIMVIVAFEVCRWAKIDLGLDNEETKY